MDSAVYGITKFADLTEEEFKKQFTGFDKSKRTSAPAPYSLGHPVRGLQCASSLPGFRCRALTRWRRLGRWRADQGGANVL